MKDFPSSCATSSPRGTSKKGIWVRLSISTTPGNVDEIAKRARNAGITLKSDPHDTEWKSRAFEVSDPSGFLLTIFSETRRRPDTRAETPPTCDPSADEFGRRAQRGGVGVHP